MKSILKKASLGMLALGLTATGAQANWDHHSHGHRQAYLQSQAYSQHLNARQDRQIERIRAGMRSGTLTRAEFRELMQEQHRIRSMEQHFRADGLIDAREFQRLDRALELTSRSIKAEKHDHQARHAYGDLYRFN